MQTIIDNNQRKFINPFNPKPHEPQKYYMLYDSQKVFSYGDYSIYKEFDKSYLYTYQDLVFNNLAGLNKEHLINVANRTEPIEAQSKFLYQRAIETLHANSKEVLRIAINSHTYKPSTN